MKQYGTMGIIGAMDVEIESVVRAMTDAAETALGGLTFYAGRIGSADVVAVQSGIGKVNAAFAASALALRFGADAVIMTGVCGGIGRNALDAVVPSGFVQHDVAVLGCPDGFVDILNRTVIEPDGELSAALAGVCGGVRGVMATGEQFVSEKAQFARILALCPETVAVDMESAAVAQICALLGVPFACVKIVSDGGGEGEYYDFKRAAADKSVGAVLRLLRSGG